jgi:hypothetical protein
MFFQSLYQSAQSAFLNYIGAQPPADGQLLRYDAAGQGWTNSVGATVDVTGNAAFTTVRVTDTLPTVSPGVFFEYYANTATLRSSSDDPGNAGLIQFAMTNNDGTLTRVAYFDGVGNFYTPGQIAGGFLAQSTFNTVDQQLHLYTVVQNLINANVTMTTDVATLGSRADIIIVTSGTTSRTVTFGTGFKTTGTLATGTVSGKYFVISFVSNGNFMIETSRTVAM